MSRGPALAQPVEAVQGAGQPFELQFAQRQAATGGQDPTLVQGQFDARGAHAHDAPRAAHVGLEDRAQHGRIAQHRSQPSVRGGAGVACKIDRRRDAARRRRHRHLVLQPLQQAFALALDGLQPAAAVAAQAHGHAGRGQPAIGRIEVDRAHALRAGRRCRHGVVHALACGRRHLKLQLDLDHREPTG